MTDEEIRRRVLAGAGWEPHEIDRHLAEHPKPDTLAEQVAILAERFRDLGRAVWRERAAFFAVYAVVVLGCITWALLTEWRP